MRQPRFANMMRIRKMTVDDIPLGMRLKEQAGWNQKEADWRRFLDLAPDGCYVAEWDGRPVGTTTTCVFESVGWIAMVLVDLSYRHRGIGTRLVEHALEYLEARGVRTARLDATAQGRPVYERLGFVAEYELVRLQGAGSPQECESDVVAARPEHRRALFELDRAVTGTRRRRLLERLLDEQPSGVRLALDGGTILGYVMLREGKNAVQIGPGAASAPEAGRALADWALGRCEGQPVFIDIPCDNGPAIQWAASRGLVQQRAFTRMCRGRRVDDRPAQLWASSGPEKG